MPEPERLGDLARAELAYLEAYPPAWQVEDERYPDPSERLYDDDRLAPPVTVPSRRRGTHKVLNTQQQRDLEATRERWRHTA